MDKTTRERATVGILSATALAATLLTAFVPANGFLLLLGGALGSLLTILVLGMSD